MADQIKISFSYSTTDVGGDIQVNLDGTTYYLPYIKIDALPSNIDGEVALINAETHHNNNQAAAWEVFNSASSTNWSLLAANNRTIFSDNNDPSFNLINSTRHSYYYFN